MSDSPTPSNDSVTPSVPSDIVIARRAQKLHINDIAAKLGIPEVDIDPYGRDKAKISYDFIRAQDHKPDGKLILVSAINPTPGGEGKTTTSIGLGDALNSLGRKALLCLREPSLGPCFGMKGGAAGGGYSQVVPMEDINLHFTGDFHAIGLAHNLLSAALDNHLQQGNELNIDPRRISWKRVVDMNDRALRYVNVGMGGSVNGVPRESGFDITVASEIMAILCLAQSREELKARIAQIQVAERYDGTPVIAADLKVHGAMTVVLKDAIKPNLVQTLERNPALIHGGPFANIAHGCSSVVATKLALKLSEFTITEAGFGADLGAEKFFDIKCRQSGLKPDAVVIVATIRALKFHGGVEKNDLAVENVDAVESGLQNLYKHIENIHEFGLPAVVALNEFASDTPAEIARVQEKCAEVGVKVIPCTHWANGGAGALELAKEVVSVVENQPANFQLLYSDDTSLWEKIRSLCQKVYGAEGISAPAQLKQQIEKLQQSHGHLPICMAKTQYSLSGDPALKGRPEGFTVNLQEVRLAAGAGFIVVLTDNIMTMPGLPKKPAAEAIDFDDEGNIVGLF